MGALSTALIATAATLTALAVIARFARRPVRWMWRRLVSEPVMTAFRREVAQIVDERLDARPLTNGVGWRTVKQIAERLGLEVEAAPVPDEGEH